MRGACVCVCVCVFAPDIYHPQVLFIPCMCVPLFLTHALFFSVRICSGVTVEMNEMGAVTKKLIKLLERAGGADALAQIQTILPLYLGGGEVKGTAGAANSSYAR